MNKYKYNPWPLGKVKPEHQRIELSQLKEKGYEFDDPREVVDICEKKIASFFGAPYCVMTDCCSHAIFLSLMCCREWGEIDSFEDIILPKHTYVSVYHQCIHAGLRVTFKDIIWTGSYPLVPTRVIDAAVMWERNSYYKGSLMCLSMQLKKVIPNGKQGAILTDNKEFAEWLKLASYDGRDLTTPYDSRHHVKMIGWHMYSTPEDCARTILLMDDITYEGRYMGNSDYPDVSKMVEGL